MSEWQVVLLRGVMDRLAEELEVQARDLRHCEVALNNALKCVPSQRLKAELAELQSIDRIIQSLDALSGYLKAIEAAPDAVGVHQAAQTVPLLDLQARLLGSSIERHEAMTKGNAGIEMF